MGRRADDAGPKRRREGQAARGAAARTMLSHLTASPEVPFPASQSAGYTSSACEKLWTTRAPMAMASAIPMSTRAEGEETISSRLLSIAATSGWGVKPSGRRVRRLPSHWRVGMGSHVGSWERTQSSCKGRGQSIAGLCRRPRAPADASGRAARWKGEGVEEADGTGGRWPGG